GKHLGQAQHPRRHGHGLIRFHSAASVKDEGDAAPSSTGRNPVSRPRRREFDLRALSPPANGMPNLLAFLIPGAPLLAQVALEPVECAIDVLPQPAAVRLECREPAGLALALER